MKLKTVRWVTILAAALFGFDEEITISVVFGANLFDLLQTR